MADITKLATAEEQAYDYLKDLQQSLTGASIDLKKADADVKALGAKYDKVALREAQLRAYCDHIEITNTCAKDLLILLDNAVRQSKVVSEESAFALDAFKYMMTDLESVSCCIEEFQAEVALVTSKIDPAKADDPVCAAYLNLSKALVEAMDAMRTTLVSMLAVELQLAKLHDGVNDVSGIWYFLCILRDSLTKADIRKDHTACSACEKKPVFPLNETTPKNPYYEKMKSKCSNAATDKATLKSKLDAAILTHLHAKTCYEALDAAYKAASAANACKTK